MSASSPPNSESSPSIPRQIEPNKEHGSERPKKRHKIAIACDTCRARKVRCDGAHPICGLCAKRKDKGASCLYSGEKDKGFRFKGIDLISVGGRNGDRLGDENGLANDQDLSSNRVRTDDIIWNGENMGNDNRLGIPDSNPFARIVIGPQNEQSRGVDSMTGVGGDESNTLEFFGSSSAGSFMRQIKSAIDTKIGRPPEIGTSRALFHTSPSSSLAKGHDMSIDYLLPSRKTADGLLRVYWTLVHPLYPFLDQNMFEAAYDSIWSGASTSTDERILMCTVNVIFALSCQLSDSIKAELREEYAKVYFKRAQDLLHLDLWDIGSTELIQCLLLMGQYLQSTNTPHQCWMVVGHAIRVAQGLGFHLPESSSRLQSRRERELARRIWHGCILMDRVLSMTFGRPAMISRSLSDAVPLPAIIDDEFLDHQDILGDTQPPNQPSIMSFFVKSLHLYAIINDILLALYMGHNDDLRKDSSQNSPFHQTEAINIARVFELDQALMSWGQNLPLHLRVSSPQSSISNTFLRQAVVCRARFLHARILLFRPILSQFCLPQSGPTVQGTVMDESLAERMVLQCSTLCLRTAHDMIHLIYTNLDMEGLSGPLPAWWYSILYVYTAATILLAARLRPVIAIGVSEYSIADSWTHAIQMLKAFQRLGQSAQRCVAALEILSAKVSLNVNPPAIIHETNNEPQRASTAMTSATPIPDPPFDDYQVGLEFSGITFDLNDMSWLTSLPGNL